MTEYLFADKKTSGDGKSVRKIINTVGKEIEITNNLQAKLNRSPCKLHDVLKTYISLFSRNISNKLTEETRICYQQRKCQLSYVSPSRLYSNDSKSLADYETCTQLCIKYCILHIE